MLKRESPVPLYHQLKRLLSDRIAAGEWQPGYMLPTEKQLQSQYELSRTTVRLALKELEIEGKIVRRQGRGTFVARGKLSHSADPRLNLTTYLEQQGRQPGWRVLSANWVQAQVAVAKRLNIPADSTVFRLRRLRLADDEPIGYHIAHVVPDLGQTIDHSLLDSGGSLDYLHGPGQLTTSYANRILEAVLATKETARLLSIPAGSPVLMIRRRVFDNSGSPVEYMQAMYRGDRFQYRIRQWPDKL